MANPYFVSLKSAADDGTNMYLFIEISDGTRTMQTFQAVVPSATAASAIRTYLQNIANAQPTVSAGIQALMNVTIAGQ